MVVFGKLTSLDYCIVAFAIIIIISTVQWFVDGRKNFHGPRTELEFLEAVESREVPHVPNTKMAAETGEPLG